MINGIDCNADFSMLNWKQMDNLEYYMETWNEYMRFKHDDELTDVKEQERVVDRYESMLEKLFNELPEFPDKRLVPKIY